MKVINYLLLISKRQVQIRLAAECWGSSDSVLRSLSSFSGHGLVVKRGFGHAVMLAGQGPRTIGLRGDLVQSPCFTDEGDGAQRGEAMGNCSHVPQASPEGGAEWEQDRNHLC